MEGGRSEDFVEDFRKLLEDEWIQQSRIRSGLAGSHPSKILAIKNQKCLKSKPVAGCYHTESAHHLFFLDIEIKVRRKKGLEIARDS